MTTLGHDTLPSLPIERRGRRQRPWAIAPLVIVVAGFIVYALPPYLTLDPARSRLPVPAGFAPYYALLVGHIAFGSVAMLTCCLQVWPWFRERYPAAHRQIGWAYVFGGVVPAGVMGLVIGTLNPLGLPARASNVILSGLWLTFTLIGFRAARQRRIGEHRRWMLRSVVLTLSIITNRVWLIVWMALLTPRLSTTFGGNEGTMWLVIGALTGWLGWLLPLAGIEWWLSLQRPTLSPRAPE